MQDLLWDNRAQIASDILERKAYIYICGEAKGMAHDVEAVFSKIIAEAKGSEEAGKAEIKLLKERSRLLLDVSFYFLFFYFFLFDVAFPMERSSITDQCTSIAFAHCYDRIYRSGLRWPGFRFRFRNDSTSLGSARRGGSDRRVDVGWHCVSGIGKTMRWPLRWPFAHLPLFDRSDSPPPPPPPPNPPTPFLCKA